MRPPPPPAGGPRPGGPARRDSSVQDEIDDFLRRVSGRRGTERPTVAAPAPKPKRPETPLQAEIVDDAADEPVGAQVGKQVEKYLDTGEFTRRTSQLGGDVAQADAETDQRLKQVFSREVSQLAKKPGEAAAPPAPDESTVAPQIAAAVAPAGLFALLGDAEGIRHAVVISEILRRPEDRWE
jgi:hypothetical protein